ncbi:hypothetical protein D3C72_1003950 [compost metagenome]
MLGGRGVLGQHAGAVEADRDLTRHVGAKVGVLLLPLGDDRGQPLAHGHHVLLGIQVVLRLEADHDEGAVAVRTAEDRLRAIVVGDRLEHVRHARDGVFQLLDRLGQRLVFEAEAIARHRHDEAALIGVLELGAQQGLGPGGAAVGNARRAAFHDVGGVAGTPQAEAQEHHPGGDHRPAVPVENEPELVEAGRDPVQKRISYRESPDDGRTSIDLCYHGSTTGPSAEQWGQGQDR